MLTEDSCKHLIDIDKTKENTSYGYSSYFMVVILLQLVLCVLSCNQHEEVRQTTVELINRAYEQNTIDFDTKALYLTYSIYDPEALPQEYQSNVPIKSATPIILEIQRDWDKLSPTTQQEISRYIQPLKKRDST